MSNLKAKHPYEKFATSSDIAINSQTETCLIDSGAQTSFVDEKYVELREFRLLPIQNRRNWVTANGSQLDVIGQIALILKIGSCEFKHIFIVARNLSHRIILGTDFLLPNEFILNFKDKILVSGNNFVKIKSDISNKINTVSLIEQIELKPFEKKQLYASIEKNLPSLLYFRGNNRIADSECNISNDNGRISLIIANPTGSTRTLMPQTVIGAC